LGSHQTLLELIFLISAQRLENTSQHNLTDDDKRNIPSSVIDWVQDFKLEFDLEIQYKIPDFAPNFF
jgi:hypothetical protein